LIEYLIISLIISIVQWLPFISFNYLKMWIHSNLSFLGAVCKGTRLLREDQRTDGIGSMSIFSSHVSTNIFWLSVLEIIVTQNRRFRCVCRERKKERKLDGISTLSRMHVKVRSTFEIWMSTAVEVLWIIYRHKDLYHYETSTKYCQHVLKERNWLTV
jgi:hypothetical protein